MKQMKLALFLTGLSLFGMVLAIPYLSVVLGDSLRATKVPLAVGLTATIVQQTIMAFLLGWIGLILSERVGLNAPIFRCWIQKTGTASFQKKDIWQTIAAGVIGTFLLIVIELFVFKPLIPEIYHMGSKVSPLIGVLTFIQGGVFEEVLIRLFLMSLIVWILFKLFGKENGLKPWMYWTGIVGAALLFGVDHLPAVYQIVGSISPILFIRTIVSNGLLGLLYGYLYWKKGLEYAMLAHAISDILFHGFIG